MTGSVTNIWRHPIKALGREALDNVTLTAGETLPFDRVWAVLHEASKFDPAAPAWASKNNFNQGAKTPAFMAIKADFDVASGIITLTHPKLPELRVKPDQDPLALVNWITPLVPSNRAQPVGVAKVSNHSLTDQNRPLISLIGTASLKALSQAAGVKLQQERFRANIWFDGFASWEEFEWIGKDIQIGSATLRIVERIGRCVATTADSETGKINIDTLAVLSKEFDHKDLGVFAEVIKSGDIAINDTVKVL